MKPVDLYTELYPTTLIEHTPVLTNGLTHDNRSISTEYHKICICTYTHTYLYTSGVTLI